MKIKMLQIQKVHQNEIIQMKMEKYYQTLHKKTLKGK